MTGGRGGLCLAFQSAQISQNFGLALVLCPVRWGGMPEDILNIEARATLDKKVGEFEIAFERGLVERRAMRVATDRVVADGIFTGIEQGADDFNVTVLRRSGKRQVTLRAVCGWQQLMEHADPVEGSGDGEGDRCATPDERVDRLKLKKNGRRLDSGGRVRPLIAEQIDQRDLDTALSWHAAGCDEHKGFIPGLLVGVCFENDSCDVEDVGGQLVTTDGIFCDELQQGWVTEVVSAFEDDALIDELRMLLQKCAQNGDITRVDEVDSAPEDRVFNPLMVFEVELVYLCRCFDVVLQSCPAGEAVLASDGELSSAECQVCIEDFGIRQPGEARVEFAESLGCIQGASSVIADQIFRLVAKMIEAGTGRELTDWHNELPFVCPMSAVLGRK